MFSICGHCEKGHRSSNNNTILLPLTLLAMSVATTVAMFIFPFFGAYFFLFLFPSPPHLQFVVINKMAETAQ